jgi:hypothetical protein
MGGTVGRPAYVDPAERLSAAVAGAITSEQRAEIERRVEALGITISTWVRLAITERLAREEVMA